MLSPREMTSPENSSHSPDVNMKKEEVVDGQTTSQPHYFPAPSFSLSQYGIPRMPYPVVAPGLIFRTSSAGAIASDRGRPSIGSYTQGPLPPIPSSNRASIQSGSGRQASQGNSSLKGRMHWYPWQVEALIEAKKAEWEEQGRDHAVVSADVKWQRIQNFMRERGISAEAYQLKSKWESVLGLWKSVNIWNNKSGSPRPSFLSMTRAERKKAKLPLTFPEKWSELLDSFYGQRPPMQPPCMADRSTIGNPDTPDTTDEVPSQAEDTPDDTNEVPIEAEDDNQSTASAESGAEGAPVRSYSGVKRKNDLGHSASALVDCLSAFSDTLVEIEKRKLAWCVSAEKRRVSSANERSAQLCSVLTLMARALERLADRFPVRAPKQTPPSD